MDWWKQTLGIKFLKTCVYKKEFSELDPAYKYVECITASGNPSAVKFNLEPDAVKHPEEKKSRDPTPKKHEASN